MTRYVVNFPPLIETRPAPLTATACSRDAAPGVSLADGSSGRMPAQAATTSSGVRFAAGKNRFAVSSRYDTSSAVARTSSGDAVVNVSVVPTIANAPAGSTNITRPSIGESSVSAS
jgi:hypothetical protein